MKLFGKPKKKSKQQKGSESTSQSNDEGKFASDAIVMDLLKLDPSELSSKQRRMIRRYKERNEQNFSIYVVPDKERTGQSETKDGEIDEDGKAQEEQETNRQPRVETSIDDTAKGKDTKSNEKSRESEGTAIQDIKESHETKETPIQDNSSKRQQVLELVQTLNSKQKRKLMRQLERGGDSCLHQIGAEALKLSKQKDRDSKETEKPNEAGRGEKSQDPSSKKRKRDWSHLPPEERMRREEQRRLQKEAAERRLKNPGDKRHPLNSERRRANRRKPKWVRKSHAERNNEHDVSGYHMRKIQKSN